MARIFKQTYTKPKPPEVEIITRGGKKHARFTGEKGKVVTAPLSEDGTQIIRETAKWYIGYLDADETIRRVPGFADKTATEQKANELERTAEHIRSGYKPREHEQLSRPLMEHLKDFKEFLQSKGTTRQHAELSHNRCKAIIDACGFRTAGDLSASRIQKQLAELRRNGLGIKSSNYYLQAIKQFCNWMVADHRLNENPLSYLKAQNAKTDVRCKRRVLTNDELARLLQVTKSGVLRRGMTGKKRAMLYLLAVNTGLRAAELASLKWGQFDFNPSESSVKVLAAYSKHRRDDTQPLPSYVAQQFQDWQTEIGACADDVVFATFNKAVGAKMLQKDLAATGILYRDDAGRVADFHSLRHTYISNLTKSGISPKVAQCLARHSTITLTMDTYTHVASQSERAAVETLPVLPSVSSDEEGNSCAALKTGTDDLPVISYDNKPDHKQGLTNSQTLVESKLTPTGDKFLIRRSQVRILSGVVAGIPRKVRRDALYKNARAWQ